MKLSAKLSVVLALAWALLLLAGWVFISQAGVEASPPANDPAPEFNVIATIPVGNDPRGIAVVPESNKIYVANYLSGTVSVINGDTLAVTKVIPKVPNANGVVYNSWNKYLYVSNRFEGKPGKVTVISTITDSVVISITVYDKPEGLAYNPNNKKIYVAQFYDSDVYISIISGTTFAGQINLGGGLCHAPSGDFRPSQIAVNASTNKLYVTNNNASSVSVINGSTDCYSATIDIERTGPYGIAADPLRNKVYVATIAAARLRAINGATDTLIGDFDEAAPGNPALYMVAMDPETNLIFVTQGNDKVSVFDADSETWIGTVDVEQDPEHGIAFDPVRNRIYVTNSGSDSVSVIEIRFKVYLPIIRKNYS